MFLAVSAPRLLSTKTYLQRQYVMSFIASLRKIPKWQLGVTSGLLFWAAALQVGAVVTLPCIQHVSKHERRGCVGNWCESDNRTEPSSLAKFEYELNGDAA